MEKLMSVVENPKEFIKLDRFDRTNFTRWRDKMIFLLSALNIYYVLDYALPLMPEPTAEYSDVVKEERKKREHDELLCRGHILNTLTDRLYDLYCNLKSPREIWTALQTAYQNEKRGIDKFLALQYFEFKIFDTRPIMDQIHELQILISKLSDLEVKIPDALQIGAILSKLPSSWNDYRKKILHSMDKMTVEQFRTHIQIESETRARDAISQPSSSAVNFVSQNGSGSGNKHLKVSKKSSFKKRKNFSCHHCGKKGHMIRDCRYRKAGINFNAGNTEKSRKIEKSGNSEKANIVENSAQGLVAMVSAMQIGMVTELNVATTATKTQDWWLDLGATIHVCYDKKMFKTYAEVQDSEQVLMGNHVAADVAGKGSIEINFTSGQKLTLLNVYHVPDMKKNLMSAALLSKKGFKIVIESDHVIVSKNGVFVGKGYNCNEDPKTFQEAMSFIDAAFWKEAINDEMDSIISNNTWVLVDFPLVSKPIGSFLNGNLSEEIYMQQPEGFVLPGNKKKVCKLIKSLYGLKQAPKQWHERFDSVILSTGFVHNNADKCIYSKFTKEYGVIICLYVDDMLIFGTNLQGIIETKKYLTSVFKMKDLNEVDTILVIKVKRDNKQVTLSQAHYIDKILTKFSHLGIKGYNTPYDSSVKLTANTGRAVAQLEYASAIGSMMYAMHCTRPDIAFAVCKLSRFTSNPGNDHWKAISRVLGYLKYTKHLGICYNGFPNVLEGYSDASWITSINDNKSTSGWIFTLGGGAISWASKKQTCISHSTMESEFIALVATGKEAEWLRNMLLDIKLWPQPMPAISIFCDSETTMCVAHNKIYNGKSRHISLRHAYIRELITNRAIAIIYVRSNKNLADPLTKPLGRDGHKDKLQSAYCYMKRLINLNGIINVWSNKDI
ncbi:uncharacterized protein LOC142162200 [Nicotiana tabacum]|uniref:Uncharacterized protein LOC142162200 n=1 Tax=Nicotiana tabacum TaxID=4097 RepID=A0AC58RPG4_TOBAC